MLVDRWSIAFQNCDPVEYELHVKKLFVKHVRGSRSDSFKDLKSDRDLGVVTGPY